MKWSSVAVTKRWSGLHSSSNLTCQLGIEDERNGRNGSDTSEPVPDIVSVSRSGFPFGCAGEKSRVGAIGREQYSRQTESQD